MEPHIQYAKTSDGVNIACAAIGHGPPIVYVGNFPAGLHTHRHFTVARSRVDALADLGWSVIRYDGRGTGASDRDALDFSLDARLCDLVAVVERLGLDRFAIFGHQRGTLVAIAHAAQLPDRISRLALATPLTSGAALAATPTGRALKAMRPLLEEQWDLMMLNYAHLALGFANREVAMELAAMYRSGIAPAAFREKEEADEAIDVTEFLASVNAPTIILEDTSNLYGGRIDRELSPLARKVAAGIPNARLVRTDDFANRIDEFLREGLPTPTGTTPDLPSGTAIIFFTDIVDSTALTERLGDDAFRAKARELGPALRALVRECGGTPVEGPTLGDGVLAVFTSAREAIEAARRCTKAGDDAGLPLHLGLHAGDVIRESDPDGRDNVYGGAVNIAARISGLSAPGEVLVSQTVRDLARTSAGVAFEDRGEQALKGVGEPVRVWAVREGE